jgi:hypothetical protein
MRQGSGHRARTRDPRQRLLPTKNCHAALRLGATREYQRDSSSKLPRGLSSVVSGWFWNQNARPPTRGALPLTKVVPYQLARYLTLRYQQRDQEVLGALFFDLRHGLIGEKEIYRGTQHRVYAQPSGILKECLFRGAAGLAIFHTHPSGNPTPSAEDWHFTMRMKDAADVMGIEFLDHLVLGASGRWASLSRRGAW